MKKAQEIHCSVTSCRHNENSRDCKLESIQVSPKKDTSSGMADESLCASYDCTSH